MKNFNYILLFGLFSVFIFLMTTSLSFDAQTGNKQFDEKLNEINKDALADLKRFRENISDFYLIDENEVSNMMSYMEPAEIILALELTRMTNKSLSEIIKQHRIGKNLGWNKILLSLGINKNSIQFKDLTQIKFIDLNKQETTLVKNK